MRGDNWFVNLLDDLGGMCCIMQLTNDHMNIFKTLIYSNKRPIRTVIETKKRGTFQIWFLYLFNCN